LRARLLFVLCLLASTASGRAPTHNDDTDPGARPSDSSAASGLSRERSVGEAVFEKGLPAFSEKSVEEKAKTLRKWLRSGEWVCRDGRAERAVDAVERLLTQDSALRKALEADQDAGCTSDQEILVEASGIYSGPHRVKFWAHLFGLVREWGPGVNMNGLKLLRLLKEDFSERQVEQTSAVLQGHLGSDADSQTLQWAVSGESNERELYRQLLLSQSRAGFESWVESVEKRLPKVDECQVVRLGEDLKDLVPLMNQSDFGLTVLKRVVEDETQPLVELVKAHPELHSEIVASLLKARLKNGHRVEEAVKELTPEAKALYETMQSQRPAAKPAAPDTALPALSLKELELNRFEVPSELRLGEVEQLLSTPVWHCSAKAGEQSTWESSARLAHARIESDPKIRGEFLNLNEEVSGNELEAILSAWRKGQMPRAELVERLELHSDRYYVTPSAKRAREILIGLEVEPELKAYLVAEHQRLEAVLKGENGLVLPKSLERFDTLAFLALDNPRRAQRLFLRMPAEWRSRLLATLTKEFPETDAAAMACAVPKLRAAASEGNEFAQQIEKPWSRAEVERVAEKTPLDQFLKFVEVKPGKFEMGSHENEPLRGRNEKLHPVEITKPFQIGMFEVTQALYAKIMGKNPSQFAGANRPVEQVSWDDAQAFIKALNAHPDNQGPKGPKYRYRLPSEAQWEYAVRGGQKRPEKNTAYAHGDNPEKLGDFAVFSKTETSRVGSKQPNGLGLHDMHGNVWEWVEDEYVEDASTVAIDAAYGHRPVNYSGLFRVIRGAAWSDDARSLCSAYRSLCGRGGRVGNLGFRLERTPVMYPEASNEPKQ
jgi:formylglycine-generating enzyme required for sulfatase activity